MFPVFLVLKFWCYLFIVFFPFRLKYIIYILLYLYIKVYYIYTKRGREMWKGNSYYMQLCLDLALTYPLVTGILIASSWKDRQQAPVFTLMVLGLIGGQPGFHPRSSASYLCTLSKDFISLILGCIIMEKSLCPSQDCDEHCSYNALGTESGKA